MSSLGTEDWIMYDAPVGSDLSPGVDIKIVFPDDGIIRIESARLFVEPDGLLCRRFLGQAFLAPEIDSVAIGPATAQRATPAIELYFDATQCSRRQVLEHLAALLDAAPSTDPCTEVSPVLTARECRGAVRYHRYGPRITGWRVMSERVGVIKLENPVLYRKVALCEAVERELMSVLGVERYETSSTSCCAKIEYDPRQLCPLQIVEILDGALANAEQPDRLDPLDLDLAICTASLPLAAVAQFAFHCFPSRRRCSPIPQSLASGAPTRSSSRSGVLVSTSSTRSSSWAAWRPCT